MIDGLAFNRGKTGRRRKGILIKRSHRQIPNNATAPPSARIGLSCQAGLLTGRHSSAAAFPARSQWRDEAANVGLTALGTFRLCTGFPILPPYRRAPDGASISGKRGCGKAARMTPPIRCMRHRFHGQRRIAALETNRS
jgi:hypothetical protein